MANRKSKAGEGRKTKADRKATGTGRGARASLDGWNSVASSTGRRYIFLGPAQDLRRDMTAHDRLTMLKKSRYAERNSPQARQIFNDLVLYPIGDGITPQSHAEDAAMAKLYEEYFHEKAKRIDVTGRFSFWQIQRILARAMLRDGDAFAAKVRNGRDEAKLQLIEGHRVGDPFGVPVPERMHDGVQFGAYGEIVGFNTYRSDGSSRFIYAPSIMHVVDQEYASGARGIPLLAASLNTLQDYSEVLELEKRAVKDAGDVTRVIKKDGGFLDDDTAGEIASNGYGCDLQAAANAFGGKLLTLAPGESLESLASNRPSPAWAGFVEALNRDIATGILPYEFVGDSSKIGGASVRLIAGKAARVFGKYSQVIVETLCVPTWGYIIGDGIANGDLPDDPKWNVTTWTTPKSVTVDAGRDAANDRADVELGLVSPSEVYQQRGYDFRTEMTRRADDMAYIAELAKARGIPFELLYKPTNVPPGTITPLTDEPAGEPPANP